MVKWSCLTLVMLGQILYAGEMGAGALARLKAERGRGLAEARALSEEGWSASEFRAHFQKFAEREKLSRTYNVADEMAERLLGMQEPIAGYVAYQHLVQWMKGSASEFFDDEDAQREALQVIMAADPFPIEYGILFEVSFDYARSADGRGANGLEALRFAIENYRHADAWERLKADRRRVVYEREWQRWSRDPEVGDVQKATFALLEVRADQRRLWEKGIAEKAREYASRPGSVWRTWENFKGADAVTLRHLEALGGERYQRALGAYGHAHEFIASPDGAGFDYWGGHAEVAKILTGPDPVGRYLSYRHAFDYASDKTLGLGLSPTRAHELALVTLEAGLSREAVERHQESLLVGIARRRRGERLELILDEADRAVGLPVGTTARLTNGKLTNSRWEEKELAFLAQTASEENVAKEQERIAEAERARRQNEALRRERAATEQKLLATGAILITAAASASWIHAWHQGACKNVYDAQASRPRLNLPIDSEPLSVPDIFEDGT